MKNNISKKPRFYISIFLVLFFLFFASQVPYSHDDWQWGSSLKWDLMINGFANYNGRYLGNLFEILITRSVLAKNIIMAIGMISVIGVVYKFATREVKSKDKTAIFLLVAILCLALPRELFRQTYSWIAAFINFIPPVILIVLYLLVVQYIFDEKVEGIVKPKESVWMILLMIPLGISTQLFSEHTTVYTVALAAFIVFYSFVKYKKLSPLQVVYLVSTIIGALIMFSNGAYSNAANNTDGYKEISYSIMSIVDLYVSQMSDTLFLNNWLLNTVLIVICLIILLCKINNNRDRVNMFVANLQMFILSTYMVYGLCYKVYPAWNIFSNPQKTDYFNALFSLVFFVCVLSVILIYIEEFGLKMKIFMVYGSAFAVAMPLIVANPIGPRCFFASYIFMAIAVIQLLIYLLNSTEFEFSFITPILGGSLVMLCVFYASIFIDIGAAEKARVETINNAVANGEKSISMYKLPYPNYYWTTIPPDEHWASFFKEFYDIPQDVELHFIDLNY
ncbi:DUF6056 family protein [Romboutsia sp.]|uniref:DUF6056 family protein n=1 Tax=Romboutsia sp. TaxID=1965302 RepID=UPI003F2B8093